MHAKTFKSLMAQVEGMDCYVVDCSGNRYHVANIDYITPKEEFVGLTLTNDEFVELEIDTIEKVLGNGKDAVNL